MILGAQISARRVDPEAGQAIRPGKSIDADQRVLLAPKTRSFIRAQLGAPIDFVSVQPCASFLANTDDPLHLFPIQNAPRRIIWIHDGDELRPLRRQLFQPPEIQSPVILRMKMDLMHAATDISGQSPHLAIAGRDDEYFVAGLKQPGTNQPLSLGGADRYQYVFRTRARVERRNALEQTRRAVDFRIVNLALHQRSG